jgi:hypothetical protein
MPVRPGTTNSTLAAAIAHASHSAIRARELVVSKAALRHQERGERHEHVLRVVRLENGGVERVALDPVVARNDPEPQEPRQHERNEHRPTKATRPRSRHSGSRSRWTSSRDQEEAHRLAERVEDVLPAADRVQRAGGEETPQRQREPRHGIVANRRELFAIAPPASQKNSSTYRITLSTATDTGIDAPSATAAHLRAISPRCHAALRPGEAAARV